MGDGTVITCDTAGTPFDPTAHNVEDRSPDCGHVYQQVSRDPSGTYTVTATSYWVAEWSSGAESGTIPFAFTASEQIRIGELHVLRTASASETVDRNQRMSRRGIGLPGESGVDADAVPSGSDAT